MEIEFLGSKRLLGKRGAWLTPARPLHGRTCPTPSLVSDVEVEVEVDLDS